MLQFIRLVPATQMSIDIIVEIPNISLVTSIWTRFGGSQTPLPQIAITNLVTSE